MKLDDYLSTKFKWLSILATWAVVGLHSRTWRWSGVSDWTDALQIEVCKVFGFAVPTFMVISGFLFIFSYERHGWLELLKKKFWSLYVPACIMILICEVSTIPVAMYLHEPLKLSSLPFALCLNYERFGICYHFWYVRALLFFFICSPVVYWLTATLRRAWVSFAIISVVLLNLTAMFPSVTGRITVGPFCWECFWTAIPLFLLGCCLARTPHLDDRFRLPCLFFAIVVAALTWRCAAWEFTFKLSLTVTLWLAYDIVARKVRVSNPPAALTCTFFVYCIHTIVLKYVSGAGRIAMGTEPIVKMVGFTFNLMSFGFVCLLPMRYAVCSREPISYCRAEEIENKEDAHE